jgi:cytidylate kinase
MATSKTKQATKKKPPKKKVQRVKKEVKAKDEEDSRNAVPIYGASDYRI